MAKLWTLGLLLVASSLSLWILFFSSPATTPDLSAKSRGELELSEKLHSLLRNQNITSYDQESKRPAPPRPILYTYVHPTTKITDELLDALRLWMRQCISRGADPRLLTLREAQRHAGYRLEHGVYRSGQRKASLFALSTVGGGVLMDYKSGLTGSFFGNTAIDQVKPGDYFYSESLIVAGRTGIEAYLNGSLIGNTKHAEGLVREIPVHASTEKSSLQSKTILCPNRVKLESLSNPQAKPQTLPFTTVPELDHLHDGWIVLIPADYNEETKKLLRSNLDRTVPIIPESSPSHNQLLVEYALGMLLPGPLEIVRGHEEATRVTDDFMVQRHVDWVSYVATVERQLDVFDL